MKATEKDINDKWGELLDFAKQHATGEGFRRGYRWLEDAFNEYLDLSDEVPGYSMGGQPGSQFNREVLAGKVLQHFDGVGSSHELNDEQLSRLKESLKGVVNGQGQSYQLKI